MVFKKKNPEKYPNKTIRLLRTPVMASLYQWRSEGCSVVSGFGEEEGGGRIKGGSDPNQATTFCNNRFLKGGNSNKYCIMLKVA